MSPSLFLGRAKASGKLRLRRTWSTSRVFPAASQHSLHTSPKCQKGVKRSFREVRGEHEGSHARTDSSIEVEYPEEGQLHPDGAIQGRGGLHFKRTLPSFSLERRVAVITGGARGLGLVMSQGLVISGADVAIVDLNRTSAH